MPTDLQLKKAVAECAGWEIGTNEENQTFYAAIDKKKRGSKVRLKWNLPMSLDDVVAACEAAGCDWRTQNISGRVASIVWSPDRTRAGHNYSVGGDSAKIMALALIEACGVEVGDE